MTLIKKLSFEGFFPSAYHADQCSSHTENAFGSYFYEQSPALAYVFFRLECLDFPCSMRDYSWFSLSFAVEKANRVQNTS